MRLDQRTDVLQQALAELRVVGVDLPSALGSEDHQGVLRVDRGEQVVDRGVGDALGVCNSSGHASSSKSVVLKVNTWTCGGTDSSSFRALPVRVGTGGRSAVRSPL